jgi:hypothetical protein
MIIYLDKQEIFSKNELIIESRIPTYNISFLFFLDLVFFILLTGAVVSLVPYFFLFVTHFFYNGDENCP